MKFLPLFATAVMAGTATLNARQVSVISDALAAIQSGTQSLDTAVQGFQGADQAGPLQSQAAALVSLINSATSSTNGIGPLTSQEALSLTGPLQDLAGVVDTAVTDVIAKKSTFASAQVGQVVYTTLTDLQTAAQSFTAAALSKVPSGLQSAGQSFAAPIAASLQRGVSAFQEFANGGGSSPSSSSSMTSSGSMSMTSSGSMSMTSGGAYPTATTTMAGNNSYPPSSTTTGKASATTSKVPTYTGAANKAAGGFGAAAAAALAVAALV